jgi:hypothetical protein
VVKRGDLVRRVRGLGTLAADGTADVKIAEPQAIDLRLGQTATVDFGHATASGRVGAIDRTVVNGVITVTVQLDAPPPATARSGQPLDTTIDIETVRDVVYVGRPVFGKPNAEALLFKIEPDGRHAVRVPVRFGRSSVNQIEVLGGLVPGDRVIVSDMTPYLRYERIELR